MLMLHGGIDLLGRPQHLKYKYVSKEYNFWSVAICSQIIFDFLVPGILPPAGLQSTGISRGKKEELGIQPGKS